jgi:hypothetical protein
MRGGRNKFGPMYKRDRARRMQMLRQRQQHIMLNSSLNTSQNSNSSSTTTTTGGSLSMTTQLSSGNITTGSSNNGLGSLENHHSYQHHHYSHGLHAHPHLHSTPPHSNHPQQASHHQFSLINSGLTLYSPDGIKQELIQIPHLSSSTSSPDSSPLPNAATGPAGNVSSNHTFSAAQTATLNNSSNPNSNNLVGFGALEINSVAASHPELVKWVNSATGSSSAGGAPSPLTTAAAAAATLHHHHSTLSSAAIANTCVPSATATAPIASGSNANHPQTNRSNPALFNFTSGSASFVSNNNNNNSCMKLPFFVRELQMSAPNDKDWQDHLFGLLNSQTYNQCEVDLFELMCKVIDQSLLAQVEWARYCVFFKDLEVKDQMKLLEHAWCDLLVLDHIHQRLQHGLQDEALLPNGQKFDLVSLALLGDPSALSSLKSLQSKLAELEFDSVEYLCLKFLLLLNPGK